MTTTKNTPSDETGTKPTEECLWFSIEDCKGQGCPYTPETCPFNKENKNVDALS